MNCAEIRMRTILRTVVGVIGASLSITASVYADGYAQDADPIPTATAGSGEVSPQVLDKRLPPVIPGQEVSVGERKMNVWSTSGPVPVAPPPEPWKDENTNIQVAPGSVGVIVDERDGERRRGR